MEKTALHNKLRDENKLGLNQKIGAMCCAMVSAVATGYVPAIINLYYTDTVGISIGAIGVILMLTKITDGFTDIIMGMLIDRTKSKLGKARPWVLAGGIGLAVTMILLFNCPADFSYAGKVAFCAAFYFMVNPFFGTMVSVASGTLPNLISASSKHRAVIGVFSSYGSLIPVALIGLLVPNMLSSMGENQQTYTLITLIFAAITVVAAIVAVASIRETVTERSRDKLTEKQPVWESLKALFANKYFLYLAFGTVLYNLTGVPVAAYYAKYIFGDIAIAALINLPSLLLIFLIPFAVPIIQKVGKRNSIIFGLMVSSVSSVMMFFANDNLVFFMVCKVLASVAVVPYFIALIPLTGEICDYALYKTGKPMDGTISSAASMGGKIGIGLTAGISSILLQISGYISTAEEVFVAQPASALLMLRILNGLYPAVLYALAAFCFWKIDLEKKGITEIQKELKDKGLR